jgi:hypothetical protein
LLSSNLPFIIFFIKYFLHAFLHFHFHLQIYISTILSKFLFHLQIYISTILSKFIFPSLLFACIPTFSSPNLFLFPPFYPNSTTNYVWFCLIFLATLHHFLQSWISLDDLRILFQFKESPVSRNQSLTMLLHHRRVCSSNICPCCLVVVESIEHCMFLCDDLVSVWRVCGLSQIPNTTQRLDCFDWSKMVRYMGILSSSLCGWYGV